MKIPCDVIARLSRLLPDEPSDDPINCFRFDYGMVLATNRHLLAVEKVAPFDGVFYIRAEPTLIEQCRTEAQWSSVIEFTPVPALKYTTAMTSMGWKCSDNLGVWPTERTDYDDWREKILNPCIDPLTERRGAMVTSMDELARLAHSSPSGQIVLEQYADPQRRPTVVRDIDSHDWVGFFLARITDGRQHTDAVVPGWCR